MVSDIVFMAAIWISFAVIIKGLCGIAGKLIK